MHAYGSPGELLLKEVSRPTPGDQEVLVRVCATSVNDFDWGVITGKPYFYRMLFGLSKPRLSIPGIELAGTVESVGKSVTSFVPGDHVFGDTSKHGWGSFAEFMAVHQDSLSIMSEKMSFEEAAALPHASMLAMQALIDKGNLKKGERVLINGAGGGVGTLGLQLAKLYDAEVTGVDTGNKLAMIKSLGFDNVIDYKQEDFTRAKQRYDLIVDAKSTRGPDAYRRVLKEGGRYVTVGGNLSSLLRIFLASRTYARNVHVVALQQNKDMKFICELFDAGKLKPVIDGPFRLEDAGQAVQYFAEGKHQGKVVISLNH